MVLRYIIEVGGTFGYGLDNELDNEELFNSVYTELDLLRVRMLTRIDQFIRHQLSRRGITCIQNCYVGFDTEYESKNESKNLNKLISVQHALQRRTMVKVPMHKKFHFSNVHPLTS